MIQIGGVYTTFCQEGGILLQKYAIEMGGVSRYFSKVSGSGVDSTLLKQFLSAIPVRPGDQGTWNLSKFIRMLSFSNSWSNFYKFQSH